MVTVEVSAKLTVNDLLVAVEQLPTRELTEFVRRVIVIQAKRGTPLLDVEDEQVLLTIIEGKLPEEVQHRLGTLREKNRQGTLTPAEHAELLSFVQQVERQDLVRVKALVDLARKRGTTVSELLRELGIEGNYA